MSAVRVIRRALGNPSFGSGAGVLAGQAYRQTLAPFFPATAQNRATPLRLHPRAKPVSLDPALVPRTVGGLSHTNSKTLVKSES